MARYRVTLDRDACAGIFACLVRDDRFVEAADGFAGIADVAEGEEPEVAEGEEPEVAEGEEPDVAEGEETNGDDGGDTDHDVVGDDTLVAEFDDDRLGDARDAAAACPPGAIDVEVLE